MLKRVVFTLCAISLTASLPVFAGDHCLENLTKHIIQDTILNLDSCKLTDADMPTVLDFLQKNPKITGLSLEHNSITGKGITNLASVSQIDMVYLNANHLNDEDVAALVKWPSVKSLNLSHNAITDTGAAALAAQSNLVYLDLDDNQIGDNGAIAISSIPALISLNLSSNKISDNGVALGNSEAPLQDVSLIANNIGDETVAAFVKHRRIFSFYAGDRITDAGAELLANSDIMLIHVIDSLITDKGAIALSKKLNTYEICLDGNSITDVGAHAFAETTTRLDGVGLSHTKITDDGAIALITNKNRVRLWFAHDQLTDRIADKTKDVPHVLMLDVRHNHLSVQGVAELTKTFKYVDARGNNG